MKRKLPNWIIKWLAKPPRFNREAIEGYIRAYNNRNVLSYKERILFLEGELDKANTEIVTTRKVRDSAIDELEELEREHEKCNRNSTKP